MRRTAWAVVLLTTLAAAGCATRTHAPVVERQPAAPGAVSPDAAKPRDPRPGTYVVKQGDTLYSIAVGHGMDPRELAALNNIGDPSKIQVGQALLLRPPSPAPVAETGTVTVSPVTGAAPIEARPLGATVGAPPPAAPPVAAVTIPGVKSGPKAMKLPYSEQNLALLQRGEDARTAPPAARPEPPVAVPAPRGPEAPAAGDDNVDWGWPAAGKVLTGFQENGNKGLAFAGKLGDPVYASAAGSVVYSGEGLASYGKLIIVKHNEKYLSVYAHNSAILVKERQNVVKGQKIAEMGTSGTGADRPRLHFEIRRFGKPVDPQQFLPSRP